jgi:protein-tyrosine phosphatase
MHLITDTLLVGTVDEACEPPPQVGALLFLAEEFTIKPAAWLEYRHIPFKEFAKVDAARLNEAVEWLERHAPANRTMVCCRAGMGRSVSVVVAYLCLAQGMSFGEAVKLAKTRRPGALLLPELESTIEKVRTIRSRRATKNAASSPHHGPCGT